MKMDLVHTFSRRAKLGLDAEILTRSRCAGRVRPAVVPDRSAASPFGLAESVVALGTLVVTDERSGCTRLRKRGYDYHAVAECGDTEAAPIIHLVFANLKT